MGLELPLQERFGLLIKPTSASIISYRDNSYQIIILARLKAEELLRRARMKRFGKNEITQKITHPVYPAKP
jgi:hypothetical protein